MLSPSPCVAVIYDAFPHYRKGIIEELSRSSQFVYHFIGDRAYRNSDINPYEFGSNARFYPTRTTPLGPVTLQHGLIRRILQTRAKLCIFLGNPRFLSYWLVAPLCRLAGRKVLFWSHGWLKSKEHPVTSLVKDVFFRIPNALLLYGNRSREIGIARGFSDNRLTVIHNSLDYDTQSSIFSGFATTTRLDLRDEFSLPLDAPIVICSARLTRQCRFELLIRAAHLLLMREFHIFLLLIGDGSESAALKSLASTLQVQHRFFGSCFDELILAKLYKAADVAVSPGKVGLTAVHSMTYGTPVLTHDNPDLQMPEYETILPGVTGSFFAEGSIESLADAIQAWLITHPVKPEAECVKRIADFFTPSYQRQQIETALRKLI